MYEYLGIPLPKEIDPSTIKDEVVEDSDPNKAILEAVYALDPVTRLPTGDIMCYLSSTTPPELKEYIMSNLMVDTSSQALPSLPEGLDDDTAFALARKNTESLDAYRQRITQFMEQQINIRNMAIENAKREKAVSEPAE